MNAFVFGSLNIDRVYPVPHLPSTGEMLRSNGYEIHVGGKGLNQAVALKKAGFNVSIAGLVGCDGDFLTDYLNKCGVDTSAVGRTDGFSGHAVIMIDSVGRNQMIIYPGANREIDEKYCDKALEGAEVGDLILMQYETSCVEYMMKKAKAKGLTVAFNPSPFVDEIKNSPFDCVDFLFVNEQEGNLLTDETEPKKIKEKLLKLNPEMKILLTLGSDGAVYADKNTYTFCPAFNVNAVDTTGAGDTFTGYALKELLSGTAPEIAIKTASAASAIAVTKKGAAETIPTPEQVSNFLCGHTT